ncbi:MAG: DUF192 domain-containing protein [Dehalococcoidia bacterium]
MNGEVLVRIGNKSWVADLASTLAEQEKGLAGVSVLEPHTGMFFDLGFEQTIYVSTEGMLFPLDIVMFSEEMNVTEVCRNIPPGKMLQSVWPARYFLEVNAGELAGIS